MHKAACRLFPVVTAAMFAAAPLVAQTTPTPTGTKVIERPIWRSGDTIFMAFPKNFRAESPFGWEVASQMPDTLRLLLVGDSAVTLNMPFPVHYSRIRAARLKFLAVVPLIDTTTKK